MADRGRNLGAPGEARSSGPSFQEYLDAEANPVPDALREVAYEFVGCEDLPRDRYTSREFFERENDRMWTRTWQFACREEHIPKVGDYEVYEIADHSLLIVRVAPGQIKAFHNVCLHRGRLLRTNAGNARELRCPFHGWCWNLDGSLKEIPARWDFTHVEDAAASLVEARVDTWGGFVFINMDPDAIPLLEYLGPIPDHFRDWALEDRHVAVHVAKEVDANWKVALEAFIESYHVITTHPQILRSTGDTNTQYDVWPDEPHVCRMITPFAVPSPHLGDAATEQDVIDSFMAINGAAPGSVKVPEGTTARAFLGDMLRSAITGPRGRDLSSATDSEMLDAHQYFVFPNFYPWGGYLQNLVYRFRPVRGEPEKSLMEVLILQPNPAEGDPPPPAPMRRLGASEDWTVAEELGGLGAIFQQDWSNIPFVQRGLRASKKPGVTLANYQEVRIRHFHQTLAYYLQPAARKSDRGS